ncbi:MAG TPA: hypothetical protein DCZ91_12555, partial [Lachnospiraceae bacterium]|nr:hypothetical protein [Lachnospiraceae bacterium]
LHCLGSSFQYKDFVFVICRIRQEGFSSVKIQKFRGGNFRILERKGGQGDMPSASQFPQVSTWRNLGKLKPTDVRRQCLLFFCKSPVGDLRVVRA